jgi:hypothetical protein
MLPCSIKPCVALSRQEHAGLGQLVSAALNPDHLPLAAIASEETDASMGRCGPAAAALRVWLAGAVLPLEACLSILQRPSNVNVT